MEKLTPKELADNITDFVNSYSSKGEEFCKEMTYQHRTLQQSFTRLCLQWLETCAGEDYLTDLRNQDSKEVAQLVINTLENDGFREPSKMLRTI